MAFSQPMELAVISLRLKEKGNECFHLRDYQGAVAHYQAALDYEPRNTSVLCNLSYALYKMGVFTLSEEAAVRAFKADSTRAKAYIRAAKSALALGSFERARAFICYGLSQCEDRELLEEELYRMDKKLKIKHEKEKPKVAKSLKVRTDIFAAVPAPPAPTVTTPTVDTTVDSTINLKEPDSVPLVEQTQVEAVEENENMFLSFLKEFGDSCQSEQIKQFKLLCTHGYKEYQNQSYVKSLECYYKAHCLVEHFPLSHISSLELVVLKYLICDLWLRSSKYQDLIEVINMMEPVEKQFSNSFLAVYYILGKTYLILNRFKLAVNHLEKGLSLLEDDVIVEPFHYPQTSYIIPITEVENLTREMMSVRKRCSLYVKPDAVCLYPSCLDISNHIAPSRNIYSSDLDFSGYVRLLCETDCRLEYHLGCWKKMKEFILNCNVEGRLIDKDVLGLNCWTDSCLESRIVKIDIYGPDGSVKSTCSLDRIKEKESTKEMYKSAKSNSKKKRLERANAKRERSLVTKKKKERGEGETEIKNMNHNEGGDRLFSEVVTDDRHVQQLIFDALEEFHVCLSTEGPQSKYDLERKWWCSDTYTSLDSHHQSKFRFLTDLMLKTGKFRRIGKYIGISEHFVMNMKKNSCYKSSDDISMSNLFTSEQQLENRSQDYPAEFDPYRPLMKQPDITILDFSPPSPDTSDMVTSNTDTSPKEDLIDLDFDETDLNVSEEIVTVPVANARLCQTPNPVANVRHCQTPDPVENVTHCQTPDPVENVTHCPTPVSVANAYSQTSESELIICLKQTKIWKDINQKMLEDTTAMNDLKLELERVKKSSMSEKKINRMKTQLDKYRSEIETLKKTVAELKASKTSQDDTNQMLNMMEKMTEMIINLHGAKCQEKLSTLNFSINYASEFTNPNKNQVSVTRDKWQMYYENYLIKILDFKEQCKSLKDTRDKIFPAVPELLEDPFDPIMPLFESFAMSVEKLSEFVRLHHNNPLSYTQGLFQYQVNSNFNNGNFQFPINNNIQNFVPGPNVNNNYNNGNFQWPINNIVPGPSVNNHSPLVPSHYMHLNIPVQPASQVWNSQQIQQEKEEQNRQNLRAFFEAFQRINASSVPSRASETALRDYGNEAGSSRSFNIEEIQTTENTTNTSQFPVTEDSNEANQLTAKENSPDSVKSPVSDSSNETANATDTTFNLTVIKNRFQFSETPATPGTSSPAHASSESASGSSVSPNNRMSSSASSYKSMFKSSDDTSSVSSSNNPMVNLNNFCSNTNANVFSTQYERLLALLSEYFPTVLVNDLAETLVEIRKANGDTLTGISVSSIVNSVKQKLSKFAPNETLFVEKFAGPVWSNLKKNKFNWEKKESTEDCCICMESLTNENKTELDCKHEFHEKCIRKWLTKDSVCPICRLHVRMLDEFPPLGY